LPSVSHTKRTWWQNPPIWKPPTELTSAGPCPGAACWQLTELLTYKAAPLHASGARPRRAFTNVVVFISHPLMRRVSKLLVLLVVLGSGRAGVFGVLPGHNPNVPSLQNHSAFLGVSFLITFLIDVID
jgi:hypothetical protein